MLQAGEIKLYSISSDNDQPPRTIVDSIHSNSFHNHYLEQNHVQRDVTTFDRRKCASVGGNVRRDAIVDEHLTQHLHSISRGNF